MLGVAGFQAARDRQALDRAGGGGPDPRLFLTAAHQPPGTKWSLVASPNLGHPGASKGVNEAVIKRGVGHHMQINAQKGGEAGSDRSPGGLLAPYSKWGLFDSKRSVSRT